MFAIWSSLFSVSCTNALTEPNQSYKRSFRHHSYHFPLFFFFKPWRTENGRTQLNERNSWSCVRKRLFDYAMIVKCFSVSWALNLKKIAYLQLLRLLRMRLKCKLAVHFHHHCHFIHWFLLFKCNHLIFHLIFFSCIMQSEMIRRKCNNRCERESNKRQKLKWNKIQSIFCVQFFFLCAVFRCLISNILFSENSPSKYFNKCFYSFSTFCYR